MKFGFKKAVALVLIIVSAFSLVSCAYGMNKVSTPYDGTVYSNYIKLGDLSIEVAREDIDEMFEAELKAFLKSFATVNLIGDKTNNIPDRQVKKGDNVTISTSIKVYDENGELKPFDDMLDIKEGDKTTTSALNNYTVEDVGNGDFLPEIEEAIIGSWTGERKQVDIQYDDKVQTEELKNKKVQMTIDIHKIEEVIMPDYSDAFVEAKTKYKTMEEFEKELEKEILRSYLWNEYVESAKVKKYPTDHIMKYQNEITSYYEYLAKNAGKTLDEYLTESGSNRSELADQALSYAQGTVKEELVLYFLVEQKNIGFSEEEYTEYAQSVLEDYECEDIEELEKVYGKDMIRRGYYWELAKDYLYEKMKVTE